MDLEKRVSDLESRLKRSRRRFQALVLSMLVAASLGAAHLPRAFLVNTPLQIVDDKGAAKITLDQSGNGSFEGEIRANRLTVAGKPFTRVEFSKIITPLDATNEEKPFEAKFDARVVQAIAVPIQMNLSYGEKVDDVVQTVFFSAKVVDYSPDRKTVKGVYKAFMENTKRRKAGGGIDIIVIAIVEDR